MQYDSHISKRSWDALAKVLFVEYLEESFGIIQKEIKNHFSQDELKYLTDRLASVLVTFSQSDLFKFHKAIDFQFEKSELSSTDYQEIIIGLENELDACNREIMHLTVELTGDSF